MMTKINCNALSASIYPSIEQMLEIQTSPQIYHSYNYNLLQDSPIYKKQIPEFSQENTNYYYGFDDMIKMEYQEPKELEQKQHQEPLILNLGECLDQDWKDRSFEEESKYPKNIIKNFMVEFQNYLYRNIFDIKQKCQYQVTHREEYFKIQKILKYFASHKKVSNSKQLLEALSLNGTREYFIKFLEEQAPRWIQRSNKLQLKQLHLLAIPYMVQAAEQRRKIRFPIKQWRDKTPI